MSSATFLLTFLFFLLLSTIRAALNTTSKSFHLKRFNKEGLTLSKYSIVIDDLLRLTDYNDNRIGQAFFSNPFPLKTSTSFSTSFIFAISYTNKKSGGDGMAFVLSPSPTVANASPGHYLGLFNHSNFQGNSSNHLIAIELDTVLNDYVDDISNNHVGIDINSLISNASVNTSYYDDETGGTWKSLQLQSGEAMQVWVEYDASNITLDVTLAPLRKPKPTIPLLSQKVNLSSILTEETYLGFSAATGAAYGYHYVFRWSFSMDGEDLPPLDASNLPGLPNERGAPTRFSTVMKIVGASVAAGLAVIVSCMVGIRYWVRRKRKSAEMVEDAMLLCGPSRVSYKDLYKATKGFGEENLLGSGGFGRVYRGTLPKSTTQVAVKKISGNSFQGLKEFKAEITAMARLKHKTLVQLIGYCRWKGELLLVYNYMENGSVDKFLFGPKETTTLSWEKRFRVAKRVAEGLLYIHEGWGQQIVHGDVKASNVLLDADFNGYLADFGLAKLCDRADPHHQTTRVVGTIGYIAPEVWWTGKATTLTDVYAFGTFLLELVCGCRPITPTTTKEDLDSEEVQPKFLVDEIMRMWRSNNIMDAIDSRLGNEYEPEEVEMLLELGILCCLKAPSSRPTMKQVVQILEGHLPMPSLPPKFIDFGKEISRGNSGNNSALSVEEVL